MNNTKLARRHFIRFLATSPLFMGLGPGRLLASTESEDGLPARLAESLLAPVTTPNDALDVFDFERVAEQVLPPAHFGYLATGTDGNETLRANRAAFDKLYLRAMRMVDTSAIDTSLELLGEKLSSPIVIAPAGSQRAFHPDGELATARVVPVVPNFEFFGGREDGETGREGRCAGGGFDG